MLCNFTFEQTIRKVKENQVGLKLNGAHQHLAYADDANLLGDNTDSTKKSKVTLIDASKEVYLEAKAEKTNYMFSSSHQNQGKIMTEMVSKCDRVHIFGNNSSKSKFDSGGN
jgi:hypothetical protein